MECRMKYFSRVHRQSVAVICALALIASSFAYALGQQTAPTKRVLTHQDYDSWHSIQAPQISRDGKFVAYAYMAQDGDSEIVVRNLTTGVDQRAPRGYHPPVPPPDDPGANIGEFLAAQARLLRPVFAADNRFVVFSIEPTKAEVTKAKKEKKKPEDMPKSSLGIMDLSNGQVVRIEKVKNFQVPEDGSGFIAYLLEPKPEPKKPVDKDTTATTAEGAGGNSTATPRSSGQSSSARAAKKKEFGSDLVLRNMADGTERTFADVLDYTLSKDFVVSDKATLGFSLDGSHLFLGAAPPPEPEKEADQEIPADEKVLVDLWHWKDDYVQPIQKIRAEQERNKSYRAVYLVKDKKFLQLADEKMESLSPSNNGLYAIGSDNRAYRVMSDYDPGLTDYYLVNADDGSRKLVSQKQRFGVSLSPGAKYSIYFDGKDWNSYSIASGATVNLTKSLGVHFFNEDNDEQALPPPYGVAGWTKDDRDVLIYDRYDVWQVSPDGGGAKNLTDGIGRRDKIAFRYVRLDPKERSIDPAKPLLLHAENEETRDSGFYRDRINGGLPEKLVMGAKDFNNPTKAKDADMLMFTASRFDEFPDIWVTGLEFKNPKKVTSGDEQRAQFNWGTGELVSFKNADGVPLKGLLLKPDNFDPKKKYPMIVYIYEHLSQGLHAFRNPGPGTSINPTYYVSNGYLIFMPDIVYKTGYPGRDALQCVLPAVQSVVDRGFVDENNIGIQGHSWGGYQIAYMVTQTNRFKAAEAGAAVVNMTSAYSGIRWGTGLPRQFQYEHSQSRIGGSLWEYPMRYLENSPLFHVDKIQTPLLLINNDEDDAVPWYQGIEFYLALRRLNKEAYMFSYNGEKHGLRKRINQKDYTYRLQEFFDHFLKGAPAPEWMEKGIPYLQREKEKEKYRVADSDGPLQKRER